MIHRNELPSGAKLTIRVPCGVSETSGSAFCAFIHVQSILTNRTLKAGRNVVLRDSTWTATCALRQASVLGHLAWEARFTHSHTAHVVLTILSSRAWRALGGMRHVRERSVATEFTVRRSSTACEPGSTRLAGPTARCLVLKKASGTSCAFRSQVLI